MHKEFSRSSSRVIGAWLPSWFGEFKCQVGVSGSTCWIMWHKCIHMRAQWWGRGTTAAACWWKCTLGVRTKKTDSSHLCVPSLVTHWEMVPYWIEGHQTLHWSGKGSAGHPVCLFFFFLRAILGKDKLIGYESGGTTDKTRKNKKKTQPVVITFCVWTVRKFVAWRLSKRDKQASSCGCKKGSMTLSRDQWVWESIHC